VIEDVCTEFRVPYFAHRGNNSQTLQYEAGKRFAEFFDHGLIPVVLHLADHDPKGIDMTRDNRERLALYARDEVEVRRIALNMDQVRQHAPPPNFAKETDTLFGAYVERFGTEECWELDAPSREQRRKNMRRGRYGDGTLDERGPDVWRLRYRAGVKRVTQTFRGTKRDAQKELRRLLRSADTGEHVQPAKVTLGEWIGRWLEAGAPGRRQKRVGKSSLARYEELFRCHVAPTLGGRPITTAPGRRSRRVVSQVGGQAFRPFNTFRACRAWGLSQGSPTPARAGHQSNAIPQQGALPRGKRSRHCA
jgi:hypothetical protein